MGLPKAPTGAGTAGKRLWQAVLTAYELDEHELTLLRQAVRSADLCDQLQAVVDEQGPLVTTRLGEVKAHPAVVELRNQRITLARLIVALRVPIGEQEEGRDQRRGIRGVYVA
jgi:hypothetical protein